MIARMYLECGPAFAVTAFLNRWERDAPFRAVWPKSALVVRYAMIHAHFLL